MYEAQMKRNTTDHNSNTGVACNYIYWPWSFIMQYNVKIIKQLHNG